MRNVVVVRELQAKVVPFLEVQVAEYLVVDLLSECLPLKSIGMQELPDDEMYYSCYDIYRNYNADVGAIQENDFALRLFPAVHLLRGSRRCAGRRFVFIHWRFGAEPLAEASQKTRHSALRDLNLEVVNSIKQQFLRLF